MRIALQERNLGKWGQLLQERTRYLPWKYSKRLREIRRLAFTGDWHLCCTPPAYCIYAMYHLYYSVMYIGITMSAPIRRLQKHMTDSLAHTDAASLHKFMARSNMEDWGIAPLEYVSDSWWAAVGERWWWYVFRQWALNDVVPRILDREVADKNRGWLNLKVLRLLLDIREAQDNGDHARCKCLHTELEQLGRELSIPIHIAGTIVVPYLTPNQKAAIYRVAKKIVKSTNMGRTDLERARLAADSAPIWLRAGGQHEGNASGAAQGLCRGTAFFTGNNQSSVRSLVFVTNQEVPRS